MSDSELSAMLHAVQHGDWDAFESIYQNLRIPLFTVLCRIVRDQSLAEDLLQEFFLRLYQSPPLSAEKPRAYLFQSARNLAVDALRHRSRETSLRDATGTYEHDSDGRMDIEQAISLLPALERQIVVLHLNADLKFREIASILELPLGTALWRYQKAINRLRQLLDGGST